MNKDDAIMAAQHGGYLRHAKGGIYRIVGPCRVQINGAWENGIIYSGRGITYVRTNDDCHKMAYNPPCIATLRSVNMSLALRVFVFMAVWFAIAPRVFDLGFRWDATNRTQPGVEVVFKDQTSCKGDLRHTWSDWLIIREPSGRECQFKPSDFIMMSYPSSSEPVGSSWRWMLVMGVFVSVTFLAWWKWIWLFPRGNGKKQYGAVGVNAKYADASKEDQEGDDRA